MEQLEERSQESPVCPVLRLQTVHLGFAQVQFRRAVPDVHPVSYQFLNPIENASWGTEHKR
jgi:hypothetical protein